MRVTVIGLRGMPDVMGGVETHCEQIFPRLRDLRPADDIAVVMRRAYVPPGERLFRGLRLVPLPHLRNRYAEALSNTLCGLLYGRFRQGAEVVHFQGIGPALLAPLARLLGQSVIVTYHSRNYDHAKWNGFARFVLRLGEVCALRFANEVVVIADWLARDVARRYPAVSGKVHVVPNGADHLARPEAGAAAAAAVMDRHGLRAGEFVVCVGRLVQEKGFHVMLDALERCARPVKLVVCGGADHADAYSQALLARASDRVVFTGALNRTTLAGLLPHASLFVLPSLHEGLPIAALEAAAAGLPLLLSDIEPNRDLLLPASNYFRSGDPDDLAAKLANPHEAYRVDADDLARRYSWEVAARRLDAVYERLARPVLVPQLAH